MKDYQFVYPHNYGEEKFYFEDSNENTIVIEAETPEEAKEKLMIMVDADYETEAEQCEPEEIDWDGYKAPHYFVKW